MTAPSNPQAAMIRELGRTSKTYEEMAVAYQEVAEAAGIAEADYRKQKAIFMTRAMAGGASAAKAEALADADDAVSDACLLYKLSAATADAHRARLTQLREKTAVGRSLLVSEREADRIHAQGST